MGLLGRLFGRKKRAENPFAGTDARDAPPAPREAFPPARLDLTPEGGLLDPAVRAGRLSLDKLAQAQSCYTVARSRSASIAVQYRVRLPEGESLSEWHAYDGDDRISRSRGRSYRFLGLAFLKGENVGRDPLRALRLLELGAQCGDMPSRFHLARCAVFGWGRTALMGEGLRRFADTARACLPDPLPARPASHGPEMPAKLEAELGDAALPAPETGAAGRTAAAPAEKPARPTMGR